MANLLPCPFCGGSATTATAFDGSGTRTVHYVLCGLCNATTNSWEYATEAEAAARWNTRSNAFHDMKEALTEMRLAAMAMMRVIDRAYPSKADIIDDLEDELNAVGVKNGFGVRATAALKNASGG